MLLFVCIGGECVLVVLIVYYVYTVGSLHCGCIGSDCVGVVYGVWGGFVSVADVSTYFRKNVPS